MKNIETKQLATYDDAIQFVIANSLPLKNTMKKPPFDATKDVTEKDTAQVQYRRLLEDSVLRTVQKDAEHDAKGARILFYVMMAVLISVFVAVLVFKY